MRRLQQLQIAIEGATTESKGNFFVAGNRSTWLISDDESAEARIVTVEKFKSLAEARAAFSDLSKGSASPVK